MLEARQYEIPSLSAKFKSELKALERVLQGFSALAKSASKELAKVEQKHFPEGCQELAVGTSSSWEPGESNGYSISSKKYDTSGGGYVNETDYETFKKEPAAVKADTIKALNQFNTIFEQIGASINQFKAELLQGSRQL